MEAFSGPPILHCKCDKKLLFITVVFCGGLGWFVSRSAASDITRPGGTIGFLMNQGGWRSGAFLRYFIASDVGDRRALEVTAAGLDSDSD